MRITDGRSFATSREGIQNLVDSKNEDIAGLLARLETVARWAAKTMDLHIPYVSGRIDISTSLAANRKADLLDKIQRNLWCTECGTTWPCAKIDQLKSLRNYAQGRGPADFVAAVEKIAPKTRDGQFPEVCL